jgi:hypothetical protein
MSNMSKKHYIYQETTVWPEGEGANHIYIFIEPPKTRTARAIGYIRRGDTQVQKWKKPYTLDLKGRTFEVLT